MVRPVPVRADPDLEQRWLVLLHARVAGRCEGLDRRARPDERERQREVDLGAPAGALAVHEPLPYRRSLGALHPRPQETADVLHRGGGDLIREPDPLDLLLRLHRPRVDEQRRRVDGAGEGVEPGLGEGRRLPDHAVRGLGPERELEAHALIRRCRLPGKGERPSRRRTRVGFVVAAEEANVFRPGHACRVLLRRFEADQYGLALAREDDCVVALHAPEVRQIEDVVGRARDDRVEFPLRHQPADTVELRVVPLPAHQRTRAGAGSPCASCHDTTGFRSTPIRSISASITSPGFRYSDAASSLNPATPETVPVDSTSPAE